MSPVDMVIANAPPESTKSGLEPGPAPVAVRRFGALSLGTAIVARWLFITLLFTLQKLGADES